MQIVRYPTSAEADLKRLRGRQGDNTMTDKLPAFGSILMLGVLILLGCQPATVQPTQLPTVTPTQTAPEISDPTAARDVALDYVRSCLGEHTPASDISWTEERVTPKGVDGVSTVRFRSDNWIVSISFPSTASQAAIYRVVLYDQATGFRWEGQVDGAGNVAETTLALTPPVDMQEDPYSGWKSYVNTDLRFAFRYPPTWTLEELSAHEEDDHGNISPSVRPSRGTQTLLIGCERAQGGVVIKSPPGAGEWQRRDTVTIMGQKVHRMVLVHEGKDKAVYYNGTSAIELDGLILCIKLASSSPDYRSVDIPAELQAEVDRIVESFEQIMVRYCDAKTA